MLAVVAPELKLDQNRTALRISPELESAHFEAPSIRRSGAGHMQSPWVFHLQSRPENTDFSPKLLQSFSMSGWGLERLG
jgi:hypothetical protein